MLTETLPDPAQGQSGPLTTFGYDNISRKISEENALSGTTAYANTDIQANQDTHTFRPRLGKANQSKSRHP